MVTNYSIDANTRCMACVCLKNAVDKFWRKTAPNSIKEEERALLKDQFLQYLNEPELKIARQMSVILGKIARFDLSHQWPDLVTKLLQILQESSAAVTGAPPDAGTGQDVTKSSQQNLVHSRCLMSLHQIIKSLASKRLCNDRKVFEELSINIIPLLSQFAFFYVQKSLLSPFGEVDNATYDPRDALTKAQLHDALVNVRRRQREGSVVAVSCCLLGSCPRCCRSSDG